MRIVAGIALVLLLSGCVRLDLSDDKPPAETTFWDDYDPALQERLDGLAADADCAALQDNFDAAEANGTRYRADLMEYINDLMAEAGCYGNDE